MSSYDVSWDEGKDDLSVERFARVVQTTGLDWEDVSLVLRTGEPLGAAMPSSKTQLQLKRQSAMSYDGYSANVAWVNSGLSDDRAREDVLNMQAPQSSNWQHDVKGRVNVSGNRGTPPGFARQPRVARHPVVVGQRDVGRRSLRSCHTKSWMDAGFLSGEGRVFQDGAMLGVMPLNMPSWGDSLNVMLGVDETVRIATCLVARRERHQKAEWENRREASQAASGLQPGTWRGQRERCGGPSLVLGLGRERRAVRRRCLR